MRWCGVSESKMVYFFHHQWMNLYFLTQPTTWRGVEVERVQHSQHQHHWKWVKKTSVGCREKMGRVEEYKKKTLPKSLFSVWKFYFTLMLARLMFFLSLLNTLTHTHTHTYILSKNRVDDEDSLLNVDGSKEMNFYSL